MNLFGEDNETRYVSLREFARIVGVRSDNSIRKAIIAGRLTAVVTLPNGEKKLDLARAEAEWRALHPEALAGEAGEAAAPSAYSAARTRREEAQAALAELELATRREELIPVEQIRAVFEPMLANFRARILAIGPKLAGELAGVTDPVEVERRLNRETAEACQELAGYEPAAGRRGGSHRKGRPGTKVGAGDE